MIVMNIRDIILLSLFSAAALTSCRKEFEKVDDVDFDVHATSSVFKVGEPAVFEMSGNPDFITFYSGETGSDYAYKDTDRIIETEMTLSFTTTTSSGTVGHPNPAVVPVAWSDDFSGEYTEEAVRNATWHDITDEFTMPDNTGITQFTVSTHSTSPPPEEPVTEGHSGTSSPSPSTVWPGRPSRSCTTL